MNDFAPTGSERSEQRVRHPLRVALIIAVLFIVAFIVLIVARQNSSDSTFPVTNSYQSQSLPQTHNTSGTNNGANPNGTSPAPSPTGTTPNVSGNPKVDQ